MKYLDVYIEDSFMGNDTLTYHNNNQTVLVGVRVQVLVRGRLRMGFVAKVYDPVPLSFEVQGIATVVDTQAVISQELFDLAGWLSYRTISPIIRCLQTILPNKLRPRSSAKKAKTERILERTRKPLARLTPKQKDFINHFKVGDQLPIKKARDMLSTYRKLVDAGYFELKDREVRYEAQPIAADDDKPALTLKQKEVIATIRMAKAHTYLLHGVTGSGKTEVYLQLAHQALQQKRQVLMLVPEISLTPQMIERVSRRFGTDVAIYHSGLNEQEKYEQYTRVQEGQIQILVGTRSAVFMPFKHLGLIVMDEEHDASYKQESVPFYHTRDVVLKRSSDHQCPVILGSASPALETYARALKGVYTLLELPARINETFPSVRLIDTNKALMRRESAYLTQTLLDGIDKRLQSGQQVILLLNRRGYHTILKTEAGEVIQCPHCDVALSYHNEDRAMHCHMCGYAHIGAYTVDGKTVKLIGSGVGTQRLQEALSQQFPNAKVLRMDADTTTKKNAHETILRQFMNGDADILVGTQMIAKGLDVENVTLVGIVNADASLAYTDYRSVEQTFGMLLQASGRSGRGRFPGEVMIQTANPNHYAIQCAIHQKYKHFFQQEMTYRKLAKYPPYEYLIAFMFQGDDEHAVFEAATSFRALLEGQHVQIIGPTMLRKLQTRYRSRVIIKGKDMDNMLKLSHSVMKQAKKTNRIGVMVDVNPLTLE